MTAPETDETQTEDERFIGYGPAAAYLGLQRNTLSSYAARGIGPVPCDYEIEDQYKKPVFTRSALEAWKEARPGQGARTDLLQVSV